MNTRLADTILKETNEVLRDIGTLGTQRRENQDKPRANFSELTRTDI